MLSQRIEKKLENLQTKWIKKSDEIAVHYKNKEETSHLREINGYYDGTHLTFYIRIYHAPEELKTKELITQLEKQYNEKIAEIKIPNDSKKNDWIKPDKMDYHSKVYSNRHLPRLEVIEKEYHGKFTQISLTTPDKRFVGEFIYIINFLFDISEIYDDLFESFKIKPLFNDMNAIKRMVTHGEYKEAIESARETSQYSGYEGIHYHLGKYFEEIENTDLALETYKKIPQKNIYFEKSQQIIMQLNHKKKLENEKRFNEAKIDNNRSIENIRAGLVEILAPYLSIKKVNTSIDQLVGLAKDTHTTFYLEENKKTSQLQFEMHEVIQRIDINIATFLILSQPNKIFEKVEFSVGMYLAENLSVDEIMFRKKINQIKLRFTDNLNNIKKMGEVTVKNFYLVLESFLQGLESVGLDLSRMNYLFFNPVGELIMQCINKNIRYQDFELTYKSDISDNDEIPKSTIKITDFPFILFKKLPLTMGQNDKDNKSGLTRSQSFS